LQPLVNWRQQANALVEQGFEPTLVLKNAADGQKIAIGTILFGAAKGGRADG